MGSTGMCIASIFKVMEYKPDPKSKGIGAPPDGKLIQEFSGKKAAEKADKLRDKLNKHPRKKGLVYFVKGELGVMPCIPSILL